MSISSISSLIIEYVYPLMIGVALANIVMILVGYPAYLKRFEAILLFILLAIAFTVGTLAVGSNPVVKPPVIRWVANFAWTGISIIMTIALIRAIARFSHSYRMNCKSGKS